MLFDSTHKMLQIFYKKFTDLKKLDTRTDENRNLKAEVSDKVVDLFSES